MTVETEGQYGVSTPISVGVGTSALNSEGVMPCPFCGLTLYKCVYETDRARWAHDANGCVMSRRFIPASAIAAWNRRALPPVDGLEVVGHVKPDHPEVVDPLFVRELSQPWMDGIFTEPVVTLSQASSVIAGLKEDCEQYKEAGHAYYARALRAEARISSLEEENKRLREALTPSGDTKAAYAGEFFERVEIVNPMFEGYEDDEPETIMQRFPVSWTTIKEIMATIQAYARTEDHNG